MAYLTKEQFTERMTPERVLEWFRAQPPDEPAYLHDGGEGTTCPLERCIGLNGGALSEYDASLDAAHGVYVDNLPWATRLIQALDAAEWNHAAGISYNITFGDAVEIAEETLGARRLPVMVAP